MNPTTIALILMLSACATPAPVREVVTQEVVVTRTERAIAAEQVPTPPAPLPARPAALRAAFDLVVAQLCAWVDYAKRADPLLQVAAGASPVDRVNEPVCEPQPVR